MKQDVIVNNTVYDGVANVVLVDADNGTSVIFNETSGATADDEDVIAGETYYADGEERTGTHECDASSGDSNTGDIDLSNLHIPWENVDNKPFYEGPVFNTINWIGDTQDRENRTITLNNIPITYYKVSDIYISKTNIIHSSVTCNGTTSIIIDDDIIIYNDNESYIVNIYIAVVKNDGDIISGTFNGTDIEVQFPSRGVYFSKFVLDTVDVITTKLTTTVSGVKKQLDSKFISNDIMRTSEKGIPGGVATLNENGKVPQEQLDIDISSLGSVKHANDIIFTDDLITTSEVGNISLIDGKATIPAKDKSIVDVWNHIFCKDKNPLITQPSIVLNTPNNKSYEVGTIVIPRYDISFNQGSYEYDDSTNVTVESQYITNNTNADTLTSNKGTFRSLRVTDSTNFIINATVNYSKGSIPSTALGNKYDSGQIKSGSISKNSVAITGYRNSFYGAVDMKSDITSDLIRGLTPSNKALQNGSSFNITIPIGSVRVIIAYPTSLQDISSIKDNNAMNAEISSAFKLQIIEVDDLSGSIPMDYKVYVLDYGIVNDTENIYKVVI